MSVTYLNASLNQYVKKLNIVHVRFFGGTGSKSRFDQCDPGGAKLDGDFLTSSLAKYRSKVKAIYVAQRKLKE